MERVEPEIHLLAATGFVNEGAGLREYLNAVGAPEWTTDAPTDGEALVEAMGRLCYRSWKPKLNPNVTRVREGNDAYLENILKTAHGSILEHVQLSFVFHNISRAFTHELVRHRVGVAISQESLRYVRLDNLRMWFPPCIADDPEVVERTTALVGQMEEFQLWLAEHYDIDGKNFERKKMLTSAFRRFAPIGLATSIGWSANIRTLRWLGTLRTAKSAEVEIRMIFDKVMALLVEKYPNFFGDFERVPDKKGPLGAWITPNEKV